MVVGKIDQRKWDASFRQPPCKQCSLSELVIAVSLSSLNGLLRQIERIAGHRMADHFQRSAPELINTCHRADVASSDVVGSTREIVQSLQ